MKKLYLIVLSITSLSLSGMETDNDQKTDYTISVKPHGGYIELDPINARYFYNYFYGTQLKKYTKKAIGFMAIEYKDKDDNTIHDSEEHKALKQIFPPKLPTNIFTKNQEYIITTNPLTKENITIKFISNGTYSRNDFKSQAEYSKGLFNNNQ